MRVLRSLQMAILSQQGHLFPWVPVFLALGIGMYFALRIEPSWQVLAALAGAGTLGAAFALRSNLIVAPPLWILALVALGLALAGARAHQRAAPVLDFRYYGPVEGRVVGIDRSFSDALRVTLDQVRLTRVSPHKVPARVRVSLHGDAPDMAQLPGVRVALTAHLSPPQGPVEPGGFDFRRHAWFQQLGAVGYTRTPVLALARPARSAWATRVFGWRMAISERIQSGLTGERGAVAAAIMTGDRSGLRHDTLAALRATNLAHLLAISGLHMGLLAGFVFGVIRYGLALVPWLALRVPIKKVAALASLLASFGYLVLSGGNVATERAFIMVAVALFAILVDRRALSLRAVAIAATIVLILRPEALLGPGFQMSFAATTVLVAVFGWLRDAQIRLGPSWFQPVAALVISSAVAGAATAPVAAAHFNQIAHFGLIANLASVPLMGVLIMPAAVAAAALMTLGLEAPALWVIGQGLGWILWVARSIAEWGGAVGGVPTPPQATLPVLAFGALFVVLWQGRARLAGAVICAGALGIWSQAERPDILIADSGKLIGIHTHQGRALSVERGHGFVARAWLENDGDRVEQAVAAARWPASPHAKIRPFRLGDRVLVQIVGKTGWRHFDTCTPEMIVISAHPAPGKLPCLTLDPRKLAATGALSLSAGPDGALHLRTVRNETGARLWTPVTKAEPADWVPRLVAAIQ